MKAVIIVLVVLMLAALSMSQAFAASATTVKSVSVGNGCSFALDAEGNVWAWGAFQDENHLHPVKVPFIDHVTMVIPDLDVVVLKDDGTVWAWGSLHASEIGVFPGENSTSPVQINITGVKYIAKVANTVYMVKTDGTLWMCGNKLCLSLDDLLHGEHFIEPIQLPIDNVSRVVATMCSVYVQKEDGSWWGWGENRDYQLDDGTSISRESPVKMRLDNVTSISARSICFGVNDEFVSNSWVLALDSAGQLYGWGDNTYWVSGDNKLSKLDVITEPHQVPGMDDVLQIGCGVSYYAALKRDGTVWAWGSNPGSANGPSLDSNTPVRLAGFADIVSISVGYQHLLAVKKDGTVWAWGYNMNGELGNGKISAYGGEPHAVQVTDLLVESPPGADDANTTHTPTTPTGTTTSPGPSQSSGFDISTVIAIVCLSFAGSLVHSAVKKK